MTYLLRVVMAGTRASDYSGEQHFYLCLFKLLLAKNI